MREREPKPPRFNRYNVYLIIGLVVFAPAFAGRGISRACRFERLTTGIPASCAGLDDWRWFLSTGGNWMAWLSCAVVVLLIAALIYQSFR
jgi:hypothetical protein